MKLNLLPTYVSKEKATRSAFVISILLFLALIGASMLLYVSGSNDFENSKEGIAQLEGDADAAKKTGDYADEVMLKSTVLLRNTALAQAMLDHNKVYPALYDEARRYIPSFYRVTSMSASPMGAGVSTLTLVGVLNSPQQYADLMLALLRWDKVQSLSRAGLNDNAMYVPAPTPLDQLAKPRKPGDAPIPDDPLKRLDYFIGRGRVTGYQAAGGFGSGADGTFGPMPGYSQVTVTIVLKTDLQTPNPRATLALNMTAPSSGSGPAASGGTLPAGPAPSPSGGGGGGAPTPGGKKGAAEDEE
jgi:hypothetical protein